jgi:hypothetical protein
MSRIGIAAACTAAWSDTLSWIEYDPPQRRIIIKHRSSGSPLAGNVVSVRLLDDIRNIEASTAVAALDARLVHHKQAIAARKVG